jgi:hypothetical protein
MEPKTFLSFTKAARRQQEAEQFSINYNISNKVFRKNLENKIRRI